MDAVTRAALGIGPPQFRVKCPACGRTIVASPHMVKETDETVWRMRPHSSHRNVGSPCAERVVDAALVNDTEWRQAYADSVAMHERFEQRKDRP
jgi:hypothetical protein